MLIVDFDGTLVDLAVDWSALRERLGIARMGEIWTRDDEGVFEQVAAAERDGARHGADIAVAMELVESSDGFAVLTDNSASAVAVFLERHGELAHRCAAVVGREVLLGPKRDPKTFERGIEMCMTALQVHDRALVTYLGDSQYELQLARAAGLQEVDVRSIAGAPIKPRR